MGERHERDTLIHTQSYAVCTVTGLAGAGSRGKLIGLSRANGMAGWGLRVTWAAGEAERRKQSSYTVSRPQGNTHLGLNRKHVMHTH